MLAVCIGFGLALVLANIRSWELEDAEAYWNAAQRLRAGKPLYISVDANADEMLAYRYAPWVAWTWVPLTYLPKLVVQTSWSVVLLASAAAAVIPILRVRSVAAICLAALLGGLLVRTASTGNLHALLIAALVWGATRRSGPFWIGVAASVKIVPVIYALIYLRRRQWAHATVAIGVMAILVAPVLLYDLSRYPTDPGESLSLLSMFGPVPYVVAAMVALAAVLRLAAGRHRWLAASIAVLATLPRLDLYDLTYLLVGADEGKERGE